jgi:hypothetical protein
VRVFAEKRHLLRNEAASGIQRSDTSRRGPSVEPAPHAKRLDVAHAGPACRHRAGNGRQKVHAVN